MKNKDNVRVFFKWLKMNDYYHLFKYNVHHYRSLRYPLEKWLNYANNIDILKPIGLMSFAPFDFSEKLNNILSGNNSSNIEQWYEVINAWEKYLNENGK